MLLEAQGSDGPVDVLHRNAFGKSPLTVSLEKGCVKIHR